MANKRMFSRDIVQSDAFLDMPSSTQALYFQLGMEADDDGFIGNPKKVVRVLGCSDDDMKILIGKRFVMVFESGVVVVKHHRINNNWDKHNNKRTVYLEEFSQLYIKENRAYTLDKMQGEPVQSVSSLKQVFRIEENRREEKAVSKETASLQVREVNLSEDGKEKPARVQRDTTALRVREKLYDMMQKESGVRPTANMGDYKQIQKALKHLKESEVLDMFKDALENKEVHTVRGVLTDREIDIYRQENV